eukprot:TRINITY_DN1718_c0_g1_i2.p1 TRINITY_DN1718_c0_g1~~TRINITY_DN1718_c0_g1_i2.p1  ORF type:complete len:339 (+),score=86.06 TRINITY_DN1718_c0_g1_i2:82-1017(+)
MRRAEFTALAVLCLCSSTATAILFGSEKKREAEWDRRAEREKTRQGWTGCPGGEGITPDLGLPGNAERLIINVGANIDPIPPSETDETEISLAIEPLPDNLVRIPKIPRQLTLGVAISGGKPRIMSMKLVKNQPVQVSASLSQPSDNASVSASGIVQPVMVLPLCAVIDAVPSSVRIPKMKTDMQGHDCLGLQSAGESIKRVDLVMAEVFLDGRSSYQGVKNDLKLDCHPFMKRMGYRMGPRTRRLFLSQNHTGRTTTYSWAERNAVWFRGMKAENRSHDAFLEEEMLAERENHVWWHPPRPGGRRLKKRR